VFTFKGLESQLKFTISSNGFLVWIPWHSYEWKKKTCHVCHGFKWKNINIYPILTVFLCVQCLFWLIGLWLHLVSNLLKSYNKILAVREFFYSKYGEFGPFCPWKLFCWLSQFYIFHVKIWQHFNQKYILGDNSSLGVTIFKLYTKYILWKE
jgi:hypothetical protein